MHAIRLVLVLGLATLAGVAGAETVRLTVDDAVARALESSLELQANSKDLDIAEADIVRSSPWVPANPYLSFGTQTRPPDGGGAARLSSDYYFGYLAQELEIAGQRTARLAAAQQSRDKEAAAVDGARGDVAAAVRIAFIKALAAEQRFDLARKSAVESARLAEIPSRRRQLTASESLEANSARIQGARFEAAVLDAQQDRDDAHDALRRQLGLHAQDLIVLDGSLTAGQEPLGDLDSLLARALQQRADLRAYEHAVQAAAAQVTLEERRRFPNVTLSGSVSRIDGDTLFGGDIGLPLPLFHTNSAEVQQALAEHQRAELQTRDLQSAIEQEVRGAYRTCQRKAAAVERYRETIVPLSEENAQLQQRLWDRDESNESDFLGARLELLATRGAYVDALEEYQIARVELDRVAGVQLAGQSRN